MKNFSSGNGIVAKDGNLSLNKKSDHTAEIFNNSGVLIIAAYYSGNSSEMSPFFISKTDINNQGNEYIDVTYPIYCYFSSDGVQGTTKFGNYGYTSVIEIQPDVPKQVTVDWKDEHFVFI